MNIAAALLIFEQCQPEMESVKVERLSLSQGRGALVYFGSSLLASGQYEQATLCGVFIHSILDARFPLCLLLPHYLLGVFPVWVWNWLGCRKTALESRQLPRERHPGFREWHRLHRRRVLGLRWRFERAG